jgi:UDP-glucose:(heptosyl)LPS alpha-1,3-glucosyltransferase
MRIALVTRRFDPAGGGTERDLMVTADCLHGAGHEVTIYAAEVRAPSQRWRVRQAGTTLGGRVGLLLHFGFSACALARRDGAELVLSFARAVGADVLRSGGGVHAKYVRATRGWRSRLRADAMRLGPYHLAQMALERRAFGSPSLKKVIAVSNLVRDQIIREFGLPPAKVVTVYNGVDLDRFRPTDDPAVRATIRRQFGIGDSAPTVLFVGNGFARKGLGFLIEALPQIKAAPCLLVAGGDRDLSSYRRRAQDLGIGDRVRFLGPSPHVERLFCAADVFALPSLFEPFGNVVMEAMASGLPVLTSAQSGVSEVIPEEMRRFTVLDPTDSAEIGARLEALIEARAGLGAIARAAAEQFTWERYGEGLLALLGSVA